MRRHLVARLCCCVSLCVLACFTSTARAEVVLAANDFSGSVVPAIPSSGGYSFGFRYAGYGIPGGGNQDYTGSTPDVSNSITGGESVTVWDTNFTFPTPNSYTYLGFASGGGIYGVPGVLNTADSSLLTFSLAGRLANTAASSSSGVAVLELMVDATDQMVARYEFNVNITDQMQTFGGKLSDATGSSGGLTPANFATVDQLNFFLQATDQSAIGLGASNRTIVIDNFQLTSEIPEPSSLVLLGLAAVGILVLHRRQKRLPT